MVIKKETSGEPSKTTSSNKATEEVVEEKSKTGLAQELEQRSQEVEEAEDEDVVELSSSSDDSQKKDEETQEIPDGEKEGSADIIVVKTLDNNNSIAWTDHYFHPSTVFIAVNTSNLSIWEP